MRSRRRWGAYRETIPREVVASMLSPAKTDPARGGVTNDEPVPAERRGICDQPWDAADFAPLRMTPPLGVLAVIAREHPESVPTKAWDEGCMRDMSHVIQGGVNELQTRSVDLNLFLGILRHNWRYTRASLMRT